VELTSIEAEAAVLGHRDAVAALAGGHEDIAAKAKSDVTPCSSTPNKRGESRVSGTFRMD
jgi:hypothetical protein